MTEVNKTVSLNDEGLVAQKLNYFKATQSASIRIRIPLIDGILAYSQHYSDAEGAGYIRCLGDKGEDCPMCKIVGEPTQKFKINILEYVTGTDDGTLPDDLNQVTMVAKVLKCGIKTFSQIKAKHKKLLKQGGITKFDMIVSCDNEAYQHLTFEDCPESASVDDKRLAAMATKLINEKFIDFSTYKDRDSKFPVPLQVKSWIQAVTGEVIESETPKQPAAKTQKPQAKTTQKQEEPEPPVEEEQQEADEGSQLLDDLGL